jgi:RNA recognition motif-containing protein
MGSAVYMNGFNPYAPNNGDDIPNDPGKMFIGGLSWQTTPESIREYFSSFGDLAEVMVMKDPATRRSRGFGFITFSEPEAVEKVMKYPVHQLDGKIVEPKVAVPRKTNPKLVMRTKKIFVGGLSATTSLEDIRAYFEQFSHVQDAMLAYDKITNRHRGFGFVTFDNEDVVDKICEIHFHEINGKMVESKKALPKEPRLSYYSSYTNPYYGGHGQLSPPGTRNYYGPTGFPGHPGHPGHPGGGGYMNGNRYYQHHPHFQGYYDRSTNSVERGNNGYNNESHQIEFSSANTTNNNTTSPPVGAGLSPSSAGSSNNNESNSSNNSSRLYSKYNNNLVQPNENGLFNGIRNNKQHLDEQQFRKQYFNEYKQVNELTQMMLSNYNNQKLDGSSGSGGSFSGSGSGAGNGNGVGAYEDDFPELTTTKFSQLRLNTNGGRLSPPVNNVPSNNSSDFCF